MTKSFLVTFRSFQSSYFWNTSGWLFLTVYQYLPRLSHFTTFFWLSCPTHWYYNQPIRTYSQKLFADWNPLTIVQCYIYQPQQTNTCWRSTIETLLQDVKYVQSQCLIIRTTSFNSFWFLLENLCYSTLSTPEQNDVIALLSLFLILNISYLLLVVLLSTLNIHLFSEFDLFIFQLLLALNKSSTHL